jgi:hypothetical protein
MYLTGKTHRFISTSECIITAEKEWKYFFFNITKEVKYVCKLRENGTWQFGFVFQYLKNDNAVDSYTEHCLDMYALCNITGVDEIELLRDIRKQKLKNIIK